MEQEQRQRSLLQQRLDEVCQEMQGVCVCVFVCVRAYMCVKIFYFAHATHTQSNGVKSKHV